MRIRPGWTSSPSPSSSPSSRAPEPPSSPSPWPQAKLDGAATLGVEMGWRRKEKNRDTMCTKPNLAHLYGAASEWLTCGSGRSNQIPQQSRMRYVAKKVEW